MGESGEGRFETVDQRHKLAVALEDGGDELVGGQVRLVIWGRKVDVEGVDIVAPGDAGELTRRSGRKSR